MRLAEWRKQQGWTQDELAAQLGCSQPFVSLIERAGDPQIPGRDWMIKIYRLTRREVRPDDFYDLPVLEQLKLPLDDQAPAPAPLFDAVEAEQPRLRQAA